MKTRLFLLLTLLAAQARAQIYHLTDLGTVAGQQISTPYAINNSTQVAGLTELSGFRYTSGAMEELGPLPGGAVSAAFAINNLGQVVGQSQFENGGSIRHAALWSNGTAIDIGTLPIYGNYGNALGINSATQVVGYASPSLGSTTTRAFIWEAATGIRDLGLPVGSKAISINTAGKITGISPVPAGGRHAFILDAAGVGLQDLGTLGGVSSVGNFINDAGHVAGNSGINTADNRTHAFFDDGVTMRDLGSLGPNDPLSDRSFGYGINNSDEIVGSTYRPYAGGATFQIPFIYRNGQMQNLEALVDGSGSDYRLYSANAINDAGEIVVDAIKISTNQRRAVLLRPLRAVSRMSHASSGTFDLDLPLTGATGIESRAGNYQIVVTFPGVVSVNNAAISSGSGTVSNVSISANTITVALTNVGNAQRLALSLSGISDGRTSINLVVPFALLVGDTNGDGFVNAADALLTRSRSGAPPDPSNFRSDVNADGFVNAADATMVRTNSGTGIPSP